MSNSLVEQLIALPLAERVEIAQALWESIDDEAGVALRPDPEAVALARRRSAELSADSSLGRTYEEVLVEARRALACE